MEGEKPYRCPTDLTLLKLGAFPGIKTFCAPLQAHKPVKYTTGSQIGGAVVRLLTFQAGGLRSTARSDYKRVALVA